MGVGGAVGCVDGVADGAVAGYDDDGWIGGVFRGSAGFAVVARIAPGPSLVAV